MTRLVARDTAPCGSAERPSSIIKRKKSSESVVPSRWSKTASESEFSSARRIFSKPPIWPLCMNDQLPEMNGWQFMRLVAPPVEARTWARNRPDLICRHRLFRLGSDQAGRMSR